MKKLPRLGVNIDHIATLRNARGVDYPCPVRGACVCEQAGAQGITLHLREDRRHIKDSDVYAIKDAITVPMNLEMAVTDEMLAIACDVCPEWVCLVPEKRTEVTTEGGLDVVNLVHIDDFVAKLQSKGIKVSLFIDPDFAQIDKAICVGADAIELHTGAYANYDLLGDHDATQHELNRIIEAVGYCQQSAAKHNHTILINAGHGLTRRNVANIAQIDGINELNIGHAIIADSVFMGLTDAVKAMKDAFKIC
ncbi:pyridoxine 5'-phosphate synthase [Moraxella nasovis]|uniref:pyridoxine 5'-phosphate synthase n=1 Tax=Moraxella nasovis TaxID=2904121 RepID=UPI001F616A29|nr:pyridoxine 5'-phosphate synthase [Moraxella nasovis]UNU74153.1 pyridoxine 5'-phosphate synthase [Moraxella nasovis]